MHAIAKNIVHSLFPGFPSYLPLSPAVLMLNVLYLQYLSKKKNMSVMSTVGIRAGSTVFNVFATFPSSKAGSSKENITWASSGEKSFKPTVPANKTRRRSTQGFMNVREMKVYASISPNVRRLTRSPKLELMGRRMRRTPLLWSLTQSLLHWYFKAVNSLCPLV